MIKQAMARYIWSSRPREIQPAMPASAAAAVDHCELDHPLQTLAGLVRERADQGHRALDNHAIAANRLDAVGYELDRLREEMAEVITNGRQRLQLSERKAPNLTPAE